jgi:uncharacterized protein
MRDGLDFRRDFPTPPMARVFYDRIRAARPCYSLSRSFEIPSPGGLAFLARQGQIVRFLISHGPQMVDLDLFRATDPNERLWASQTMNLEGFWLTTYSRLWSNMPNFRPLATIVEDTIRTDQTHGAARHHYIYGAHCNRYFWLIATGRPGLPNCYDNLCRAIEEHGLGPDAVHDNLNLFAKALLRSDGSLTMARSDARPGDFVDFYAEMDLLFAASLCPRGSGATEPSNPYQERYPITIEIYDTGIAPLHFWRADEVPERRSR